MAGPPPSQVVVAGPNQAVSEKLLTGHSYSAVLPLSGTTVDDAQVMTANGKTVLRFTRNYSVKGFMVCPYDCEIPPPPPPPPRAHLSLCPQSLAQTGFTTMIWARGAAGAPFSSGHTEAKGVEIDLSNGAVRAVPPPKIKVAHGALMFTSMGLLFPLGAFVARFCKNMAPTTGPRAWLAGRS